MSKPGDIDLLAEKVNENIHPTTKTQVIYTCPMHPEIERDPRGTCPKWGMELEPKTVDPGTEEFDTEQRSMTRRLWLVLALTVPVLILAILPIAASVLYSISEQLLLNPMTAAAAMIFSFVSVIGNSLRLRTAKLT